MVASLSVAFAATKVKTLELAVTGLPPARLVPPVLVPVRITVLLAADWLPAASFAFTKYETVALSGRLSV